MEAKDEHNHFWTQFFFLEQSNKQQETASPYTKKHWIMPSNVIQISYLLFNLCGKKLIVTMDFV